MPRLLPSPTAPASTYERRGLFLTVQRVLLDKPGDLGQGLSSVSFTPSGGATGQRVQAPSPRDTQALAAFKYKKTKFGEACWRSQ